MPGVELDHMPVWIADIDLREPSGGMGLQDHAVRIVGIGILAVAFGTEKLDGRAVAGHTNGEMDVAGIERLFPESGASVNDQVQMLGIADLKPSARKIEWRPGDLFHRQDLLVELSRPLDVGDSEGDVVDGGDFHTRQWPIYHYGSPSWHTVKLHV